MSASGLNQHTTDLPPLGREGATSQWSTLLHQAFMMLVINGFRFFAVFAMFPIMVFMIMEVSGYIVLMTTGTSCMLTQVCATKSGKLPNSRRRARRRSLVFRKTTPQSQRQHLTIPSAQRPQSAQERVFVPVSSTLVPKCMYSIFGSP